MYRIFKWIIDRLLAFIALAVVSPLLLLIALAIVIDSPGGVFFVQKREGYKKKTIKVLKFRTMCTTHEAFDIDHAVVSGKDKRVTRVGRFLRRSKFDEIPQLINILKGDMSFVGPRPLLTVYFKRYKRWEFQKFSVLPGLTGLPQVHGNGYLSVEGRSYYDAVYAEKRSLFLDFKILLRTVGVVFRGEKAFLKEPSKEELDALIRRYQSPEEVVTVAEVIGNASLGGVKSVVENYLDHMDTTGLDLHIFTYGPSASDEEFRRKGWTVHYLPNFINFPRATRAFLKELRARHFDIVHSHLTSLSVFPLWAAKRAGVDVRICHAHSTTSRKESVSVVKNFLRKFAAKYATHLLACSVGSAEWLYGKRAAEATLLHNAIDLGKFAFDAEARREIREDFGIDRDAFVVGCVARFETQKNLLCLVKAFARVAMETEGKLLLVGEGKKRAELERAVSSAGIKDRVIFAGETKEPWKYYSAMDLFALPSLYEGLPVVGIEAQASGLPVLFSDAVTREAAVARNVSFLPATPVAFAEAIISTPLERADNLEALAAAGYDITSQAKCLRDYYDDAFAEAEAKVHSKRYTMVIAGKKRTFYASAFAPWKVIHAVFARGYDVEKYFRRDQLLTEELLRDYERDHPEEYALLTKDEA